MAPRTLEEIPTPALVVDLDVMEANLAAMAEYVRSARLSLRPHIKTHKVPEIAARQLSLGAVGLTVAKVGEAEAMIAGLRRLGWDRPLDVLVAYPVLGPWKAERLAQLVREDRHGLRVSVATDSVESLHGLSRAAHLACVTLGVLVDVDVGFHRTGVQSPRQMVELAEAVRRLPGLHWRGVFCYPGHVREHPTDQDRSLTEVERILAECVYECRYRLEALPEVVSSGSTPSARQTAALTPSVNEIRPGTYVFNDRGYHSLGANALESCALTVRTTVVSTARPGQVVLDAGSKVFSSDRCPERFEGFGHVREFPDATIVRLNEEHGWVDVSRCEAPPTLGAVVSVIPNHVCTAVNLTDVLYGVRAGRVEAMWPVAARGRVV